MRNFERYEESEFFQRMNNFLINLVKFKFKELARVFETVLWSYEVLLCLCMCTVLASVDL